jgi:hypothetical protein
MSEHRDYGDETQEGFYVHKHEVSLVKGRWLVSPCFDVG